MKDTLTYYNEIKEIIHSKKIDKLLRYLKSIPTEDFEKVIKATDINSDLSIWSYFNATVQLGPLSRGQRGDNLQQLMAKLAFLAVTDYKTINSWHTPNDFFLIEEYSKLLDNFDEYFIEILTYRKVKWLNKWLSRNRWRRTPYITLFKLHSLGLLKHDKQLFVSSLAELPNINLRNFDIKDYIKNNTFLIENDLYSIFEYELYFIEYWLDIFQFLIDEKKIEKYIILNKCIEAIKRNFKRNFINQYRELFIKLNPTIEEKLTLQHELFELFNQPLAANVNFAIDQIKSIAEQKEFDTEAFLLNTESILPRNDLKTGIKAILSIYEKIAKKQRNFTAQICMLTSNCLISTESSIQEKAAKIIKTYGDTNDEMLLASIGIYAEQLNKTTLEYLQDFSINKNQITTSTNIIDYQYIPVNFPKTIQEKPIEYISNWNDLLFQVGKVLKSTDPIDAELLFDGIIRLKNQFPTNYKEQLEPFLKQAKSLGWNASVGTVHGMVGRFIERWVINFENETNEQYFNYFKYFDSFIGLYFLRLRYVSEKFKSGTTLPLLSTPTHAPFWVSAEILVNRLLDYQEVNESINDLDFLVAITRIVFVSNDNILEKANKLNGFTKDLVLYLLTDNQSIKVNESTFLNDTTQKVIKFFTKFGGEIQLTEEEKQVLFWAIVARTKNCEGIYSELALTNLKDYPNVIKPYQITWEVKEIKQKQQWSNKLLIENKIILNHHNSAIQIKNLLYSFSYYFKQNSQDYMPADTNFIYSFIPNYAEPFYFRMINVFAIKSDLTADTQKKAFHQALKTLLIYGQNIDKSANLFLATGFLSNAPMNRDLSVEIFIQGVNESRLNVALLGHNIGKLLAGNYAPLQRLFDSLLALKNISALNDTALLIFFENMLLEFSEQIPKSFAKLLEFYNELLLNHSKELSIELQQKIVKWKENESLRKQLSKMKGFFISTSQ